MDFYLIRLIIAQFRNRTVELNAFTSPALIAFLERKLREAGAATKVIPPLKVLKTYESAIYTKAVKEWVHENAGRLLGFDRISSFISKRFGSKLRKASPNRLTKAFCNDSTKSWRGVISDFIARGISEYEANLVDALEQQPQEQVAAFAKKNPDVDTSPPFESDRRFHPHGAVPADRERKVKTDAST